MTKAEYNNLNDGEKLDLAWFLWNRYIDLNSPSYNQEFHFTVYGSRRLFVNSKNIGRRGSELFGLEIIRNIKMEDIPASKELDFIQLWVKYSTESKLLLSLVTFQHSLSLD